MSTENTKSQSREQGRRPRRGRGQSGRKGRPQNQSQFDTVPVSIRRVTKVTSGAKRMRFSVMVVVGDKKGQVGIGLGKGPDVRSAMEKATRAGKKNLITVPIVGTTIPHEITIKRGAAKIVLLPALPGTGVIAGGPVRAVAELAGIKDLMSKVYGTNNQINNVYATVEGLSKLVEERADGSFKVKPLVSKYKVVTLADMDKKSMAKGPKKIIKKAPAKKVNKEVSKEAKKEIKAEDIKKETK